MGCRVTKRARCPRRCSVGGPLSPTYPKGGAGVGKSLPVVVALADQTGTMAGGTSPSSLFDSEISASNDWTLDFGVFRAGSHTVKHEYRPARQALTLHDVDFRMISLTFGHLAEPFAYTRPQITGLSSQNSPASGAKKILIGGTNFGVYDFTPVAKIGQSDCKQTEWQSDTSLRCTTAEATTFLAGQNIQLQVEVKVGLGHRLESDQVEPKHRRNLLTRDPNANARQNV